MKRKFLVRLEYEAQYVESFSEIKRDIVNELSCCWHSFDAIKIAEVTDQFPAIGVRENVKGEWVGVHAYCDYLNEEAKVDGKTERYFPTGMVIGVYCNQCWCRADKKSDFCPNCGAYMGGDNNEKKNCSDACECETQHDEPFAKIKANIFDIIQVTGEED